jgi:hypothetical protein
MGAGARAGSCDEFPVAEELITIVDRDRDPRNLGEAERPLFFT